MQTLEFAGVAGAAITDLGGAFMTDEQTDKLGADHGLDQASFYGLGRAAVLGDAPPAVVASAYPFIDPGLVMAVYSGAVEKLSARDAVDVYAEACQDWGRRNLGDLEGIDRLSELLESIVDAAPGYWGPLFAGWRAVPLPDDAAGRVGQLLHVGRELRGAMHVAALLNSDLSPVEAVMVSGGAEAMAQYLWPEPYPDPEPLRASHEALQAKTDEMFGEASAAIDAESRSELAGLLSAAVNHVAVPNEPGVG